MRVRTALLALLAVNVLWAAAFVGYVQRSKTPVLRGGEIVRAESTKTGAPASSNAASASAPTNTLTNKSVQAATTNPAAVPIAIAAAGRQFGWQDVTNEVYKDYIVRLRAVGCPEKQVRSIVLSDINELLDKRRLENAIRTDTQWWKADMYFTFGMQPQLGALNVDQERRDLLEKLLGANWVDTIRLPPPLTVTVPLAGPVLGALPAETWNAVQEVCARALDRSSELNGRLLAGQPVDPIETAKLREFTRSELVKILTPEQMEEFLLRYSNNSTRMRQEWRGLELTPDEFRKLFRTLDPIEHRLQLDYGGPEALSQKQREQFEAQRDRAIREALSPERYQQYALTKDPLYKQAQMTAMQYGMNGKAIQPIYELQKSMEARRVQITQNAALTPEQKAQALQTVAIEQQQSLQRMMTEPGYRQ